VDLAASASEFRVTSIRAMRGPNYWRLAPVIACDVRQGAFEGVDSSRIVGFADQLLHALPGVGMQPCRLRHRSFAEALKEGTSLPHVLKHVALELQTIAGSDVSFGRVARSGEAGLWWVIVAYEEEEVGIACMRDAARVLRACVRGDGIDSWLPEMLERLRELNDDVRLGPSTGAIVEEAARRGIPVRRINSRSLVRLGLGRNLRRVQATITDRTSAIAVEIAQDKAETKETLAGRGLPVPAGQVIASLEAAEQFVEREGYPVILKPLAGNHGRGVSSMVTDAQALHEAWDAARRYSSETVIERFHEGRDHRVLVVNGRVVACAERVPAHVIGDGRRSIQELIEDANQDPRRGKGHRKVLTYLPDDEATRDFLASSGRDLQSVPAEGERVALRQTANLSTGGTSIDRTEEMHAENVTACEIAAGAIGLDIAGIDVISPDISVPFRENGAVIVEVNAAPGIRMHTHPTEGVARRVAAPILDMLYPPGAEAKIPILAVTGTNGKTTTVRLLAHLFRNTGEHVGFTTTDGVYVQNRLVMAGDMAGPFAANIILSNPNVSLAVLETARGGMLRAGLAFDECDLAVVLNVSTDHLGIGGINTVEQLADLKGVIAAVVRREGHAVLNADDPLVYRMRERTPGDVVLFSTQECGTNAALEEHTASGGVSACMMDGQFVIRRRKLHIPIAHEREVPLMMGGAARFQRQNILAATVAAYVRGMRYDDIRAGLLSFFPSPALTPGRLNIIPLANGARAIVDYAHNAAAVAGIIDMVQSLPGRRHIGVLAMPGDRRDEDIRGVARQFARFDHLILKEDDDRRGRNEGEVVELLRDGLRLAGCAEGAIEIIPNEADAVRRGLALLEPDDVLLVMANDVRETLAVVNEQAAESRA
jgi:cyanophycin synthetase